MGDASSWRSGRRLVRALSRGRSGGFRSDLRSVGGEPSKRASGQLGLSEGTPMLTGCPGARLDAHWTGVHFFVAMTSDADADIARHP
jgi:hypothetical protein